MKYDELQKKKVKSGIVILYIILMLPFFGISGIRNLVGGLYPVWQAGSMYALVIIVLLKAKSAKLDSFVVALAMCEFLITAVTSYYSSFSFGIFVVSMFFVLITISTQFYRDEIIRALAIISVTVIYLNLISIIGYVSGAAERFFIGGKNHLSMFMIPAAACIIIHAFQKRKALNFLEIFTLFCIVCSILIGASGAGIVCTLLAIVLFASNKLVRNRRMLFITLVLLNLFLLFGYNELMKTNTWMHFTEWLGKDASMTGRTSIWETTIEMFQKRWLFGYGRGVKFIYLGLDEIWIPGYETHNMFLQVLYVTGVVGLVFFIRYLAKAISRLNMNDTVQRVLFIAIFICMVNGLVEANNDNTFFRILLALAYYSKGQEQEGLEEIEEIEEPEEKGDEVSVREIEETAT